MTYFNSLLARVNSRISEKTDYRIMFEVSGKRVLELVELDKNGQVIGVKEQLAFGNKSELESCLEFFDKLYSRINLGY